MPIMVNLFKSITVAVCVGTLTALAAASEEVPLVSRIFVGQQHVCGTTDSGETLCFGDNSSGNLGTGTDVSFLGNRYPENSAFRDSKFWSQTSNQPGFVDITHTSETISDVQFGRWHTCVLFENGKIKCFGQGKLTGLERNSTVPCKECGEILNSIPYANLGTDEPVEALAVGLDHTCTLFKNKKVKCFGNNDGGELGIPIANENALIGDEKGEMGASLPFVDFGTGRGASKIFAHYDCTVAILDDGTVSAFGCPLFKDGEEGDIPVTPQEGVIDFGARKVVDVAPGVESSCFLLDNQQVTCLGSNKRGQLGLGLNATGLYVDDFDNQNIDFVNFGTGRSVKKITQGTMHVCAILDNDKVKCFGSNSEAGLGIDKALTTILGRSTDEMGDQLPYVNLGESRTALSIGIKHGGTCVLLDNKQVKCWGLKEDDVTEPLRGIETNAHSAYVMGPELPIINFVQPVEPSDGPISTPVLVVIVVVSLLVCAGGVKFLFANKDDKGQQLAVDSSGNTLKSDNPLFV